MMKRVPSEVLRAGIRLPGDLRDESGRVLAKAGVCLTGEDVARIKPLARNGLYSEADWPEEFSRETTTANVAESDGEILAVDRLTSEIRLPRDIYDENNVLLLAAGTKVTEPLEELLRRRNIIMAKHRSMPPERIVDHHRRGDMRELDESLVEELSKPIPNRPVRKQARPRLSLGDLRAEANRGLEMHAAASNVIGDISEQVHAGAEASSGVIRGSIDAFVEMACADFDVLTMVLSMQESDKEYLFDHCVNVALLSMSMAAQLGWKREQMMELGLGALLQDVGMLHVPEAIRLAPRCMTSQEWSEIRDHPYYTLDYLERIAGLPQTVKFIAYQSHEREDRSGYPKKRSGMYLHPYSKIVAIADCYCAMTGQRPHRPAMMPYEAAKTILLDGSVNKFDRTFVGAFLDAISLFPVGSFVELSDGKRAQVIRANPGSHTRPVVEEVDAENRTAGAIIDLSQDTRVKVVRAHPG